jgi:hypothetical protein
LANLLQQAWVLSRSPAPAYTGFGVPAYRNGLKSTQRRRVVQQISFSLEPLSSPGPFGVRSRLFEDNRGYFMETWSHQAFGVLVDDAIGALFDPP